MLRRLRLPLVVLGAALEAMDRTEGRDGDDRSGPNRGRGRDGGGSG